MRRPVKYKDERGSVRSPRFAVPVRATLVRAGEEAGAQGRLADLSCHGALIRVTKVFPVGAPVVLRFELVVGGEHRHLEVPGVVTRLSFHGTAVEFRGVPEDVATLLRDYSMQRLFGDR
jgi:hypothetical protein